MNTLCFSRYALSVFVAAAMLAACGATQPPMARRARYRAPTQDTSIPDGVGPSSRLVALNGTLYGTTGGGGTGGEGTVYSITTSGAEQVLHSFATGCQRRKTCSDGLYSHGSSQCQRHTLRHHRGRRTWTLQEPLRTKRLWNRLQRHGWRRGNGGVQRRQWVPPRARLQRRLSQWTERNPRDPVWRVVVRRDVWIGNRLQRHNRRGREAAAQFRSRRLG